jgi:aryl-alcohol dehydrogenase-like predicted oxidoreductase
MRDDVLAGVQQLVPIADAENLTMPQLALAWVLQNDNVASAITGGSRPEQVTSNAAAADRKLSPGDHGWHRRSAAQFHRDGRGHGGRNHAQAMLALTHKVIG